MRRYSRVWTVYRKELIETLRDRRTLIAMVLVPIVLYPVLMVVLIQALKLEKGRQEREKYKICVPDAQHKQWLEAVLAREEAQRESDRVEQEAVAEATGEETEPGAAVLTSEISAENIQISVFDPEDAEDPLWKVLDTEDALWEAVERQLFHAAILIEPPPDPDPAKYAEPVNRVVQVLYSDTNPLSEVIYRQMTMVLSNEAERIIKARLKELSGGDETLTPLFGSFVSTTSPDRQFAKVLAMIVPFLLVTMTVTGAMYPAIDLTAGERERGTLETLAVSPVPVGQIVAGKFGVIVTIAMTTTALNLASMTAVLHFSKLDKVFMGASASSDGMTFTVESMIAGRDPDAATAVGQAQKSHLDKRRGLEQRAEQQVGFVTTAAPIVLMAMLPFAILFSAVMLATCSFARTFKEAQNYMMPVMMSAIMPALIVSYMPTIKLEGAMLVIPVANIVVLMRELFLGNFDNSAIGICLASTCFYAAAAVIAANRVYGNEAVLFSDVGTYKTMLLRKFMRPQTYPSAALAVLTVAVIFPLNFYVQASLMGDAPTTGGLQLALLVSQILLFAAPVMFLAWYLKLDLVRTFSISLPRLVHLVGALLIAVSIATVADLLARAWLRVHIDTSAGDALKNIIDSLSIPMILCFFAVLPGICEEILFRGFLMAGLRERLSGLQVILVVGIVFGLYHVIGGHVVVTSTMGLLLTFVCLRSGSIFLAMLIHIANNAVMVMAHRITAVSDFTGIDPGEISLPLAPLADEFTTRRLIFLGVFFVGVMLLALRPIRQEANTPAPASSRQP